MTQVAQQVEEVQARIASLRIAAPAVDELQGGNSHTATLLGIRALNTAYTARADTVLFDALRRNRAMLTLTGHTDMVFSAVYSPDGRFVVTASSDGTAIIWETDYRDFVTYACERLANLRDFTDDERERFGITDNDPTCPQFARS